MKIVRNLTEDETNLLEMYHYQNFSYQDLIAYLCSDNHGYTLDPDKVVEILHNYDESNAMYQYYKELIQLKYRPAELINKMYNFDVNFSSNTITYIYDETGGIDLDNADL